MKYHCIDEQRVTERRPVFSGVKREDVGHEVECAYGWSIEYGLGIIETVSRKRVSK